MMRHSRHPIGDVLDHAYLTTGAAIVTVDGVDSV